MLWSPGRADAATGLLDFTDNSTRTATLNRPSGKLFNEDSNYVPGNKQQSTVPNIPYQHQQWQTALNYPILR